MKKFATTAIAVIALAGEWVSTPDGRRVCQLAYTLQHGMVLTSDFCMSWQPGFLRPVHAQPYPFHEGWIRSTGRFPGYGTLQFHIEGKGWVP